MRWRVEYDDIRHGGVVHEELRYFRWRWAAWLSAWRYCQRHPLGAATILEARRPALEATGRDPYRAS